MNVKIKIILVTVLTLMGIRSLVILDTINQNQWKMDAKIYDKANHIKHLISIQEKDLVKEYSSRLNTLLSYDTIKNAIKSGNSEAIASYMSKRLIFLKKEKKYIKTLHLIDKNNITIFRAHKPQKSGDDLTNIRPIVVKTNQTKKIQYGYETGKHDINFRIDVPVIYDGIHYGVLELGIDTNLILDKLEGIFESGKALLLIKESKSNSFKYQDRLEKFGQYYVLYKNSIFDNIKVNLLAEEIMINEKSFHSVKYGLKANSGEYIGQIRYFNDITSDVAEHDKLILRLWIQTFMIVLLIVLILYFSFSYYEKKILELSMKNKEQNKMLLQQSKLAIMGEMISMIAHQWRQPITAVSTIAQGILFKKRLGNLTDEYLESELTAIKEISLHMSETITDFSNFFKPQKEKRVVVLKDLINKVIKLASSSLKNNSIKVFVICDNNFSFNIYDGELQQVIINIINNAKDALVENINDNRKIDIEVKIDNSVKIYIKDNAGGIPKEIINNIFDPYFSTKSKNGTGLGLYMSKIIIDDHFSGLLSVQNIEDGAQFLIDIPKE
jgi:signal transduction histidine kinase